MLLECESCGAPLDVAEKASIVRCAYCGRSASVAKFRTVSPQTPAGFVPPQQWIPPSNASVSGRPLAFRPRSPWRMLRLGAFSSLWMMAIGGFVAWRVTSAAQTPVPDATDVKSLVGKALSVVGTAADLAAKVKSAGKDLSGDVVPLICRGNDDVTITGKELSAAAGVPIMASGNCSLRLVRCTVNGVTAIVANGNSTIIIEGGSVVGKGPAVVLSDNATLETSSGARLSGEVTITASGNAHAKVHDSSVSGAHVAVHTSGAATVDTTGSSVEGQVLGAKRSHR